MTPSLNGEIFRDIAFQDINSYDKKFKELTKINFYIVQEIFIYFSIYFFMRTPCKLLSDGQNFAILVSKEIAFFGEVKGKMSGGKLAKKNK